MQLQKKLSITVIFFFIKPCCTIQSAKGDCKKPETQIASQTKRINIFGLYFLVWGISTFQAPYMIPLCNTECFSDLSIHVTGIILLKLRFWFCSSGARLQILCFQYLPSADVAATAWRNTFYIVRFGTLAFKLGCVLESPGEFLKWVMLCSQPQIVW